MLGDLAAGAAGFERGANSENIFLSSFGFALLELLEPLLLLLELESLSICIVFALLLAVDWLLESEAASLIATGLSAFVYALALSAGFAGADFCASQANQQAVKS